MLCYVKKDCPMESATFGVVNVSPSPDPMAGELTTFTQQLGDRNIAINALMVDGNPWFRGNDVATALGYTNKQQVVREHVDAEDRCKLSDLGVLTTSTPAEHNEAAQVFISEAGVYTLIMRSKKPGVKLFQRWVTKYVLPTIRQTGQYTAHVQEQAIEPGNATQAVEVGNSTQAQELLAYYQLAAAINSTSQDRLRRKAQAAIDSFMLPDSNTGQQYVDAEQILRERAYTETQIGRLCGELGKDLKLVVEGEGKTLQSHEHEFGPVQKRVGWYHRVKDVAMIEDVLASFKKRELYTRVMAGAPDPIRQRREEILEAQGRGRSRSYRRRR